MPRETPEGESVDYSNLPHLDRPALVSGFIRARIRHSPASETVTSAPNISTRRASPAAPIRRSESSRLETLRRSYDERGISRSAIELSSRDNTNAAYESAWVNWGNWCLERNSDPLRSDLTSVSAYLAHLHAFGKSYSTINLHRSMLSTTLPSTDGSPIGKHPLIIKLLKIGTRQDPVTIPHGIQFESFSLCPRWAVTSFCPCPPYPGN